MKAGEYQNRTAMMLRNIFKEGLVRIEWDVSEYDGHTFNHNLIYAPRVDIAVGPFNSYMDLDIGIDKTKPFQNHPFTKKLSEVLLRNADSLDQVWSSTPLCYLAIEIEFSGSSKHILGSIINACVSGAIGIVVANKENLDKVQRAYKYIMRLDAHERISINYLRNLVVFEENEFLDFLSTIKIM